MATRRKMPQKIRPNVARQLILVGLALGGITIGYGVGFVFNKDKPAPIITPPISQPQPLVANPTISAPVLPENKKDHEDGVEGKIRAYEEALPKEIVESQLPLIEPTIPPRPLPTLQSEPAKKTVAVLAPEKPINQKVPDTQAQDNAIQASETPPKWQHFAVHIETDNRPKIAIVIDDMGIDRRRSKRATELPAPLTLSFLTYGRDLAEQTRIAREAGHELLMHIPMEPTSATVDPGPNVLLSGMAEDELLKNLDWNLDQFDGYIGVNNHMGSRFTENREGMLSVMKVLKQRGLLFLDSMTSPQSKGRETALLAGLPVIVRNIFLDHVDDLSEIRKRLRQVERLALKQGHAVAIGHPRDATLEALGSWLETVEDRGFQLVPLSAIIPKPVISEVAKTTGQTNQ